MGTVTALNFHWTFLTPGHDFLWDDAIRTTVTSPNGVNSCAFEATSTESFCSLSGDDITFQISNDAPALILTHQDDFSATDWQSPRTGAITAANWIATPSPGTECPLIIWQCPYQRFVLATGYSAGLDSAS